jgi:hypothetical protein
MRNSGPQPRVAEFSITHWLLSATRVTQAVFRQGPLNSVAVASRCLFEKPEIFQRK